MSRDSLSRRGFLRGAAGTGVGASAGAAAGTAALAGSGTVAAQTTRPDWGGWLQGVEGGFTDARGQDEVKVQVGASGNGGPYAFSPAGLWIDPGTTVVWEWVSNTHNIVVESQPQGSTWEGTAGGTGKTYDKGHTYEHTFEGAGIRKYYCNPHLPLGMKGAIAVGDDVPTTTGGGGGDGGQGTPTPTITTPTVVDKAESSFITYAFGLVSIAFVVVMTAASLHLSYLDHRDESGRESGDSEEGGGDSGE